MLGEYGSYTLTGAQVVSVTDVNRSVRGGF